MAIGDKIKDWIYGEKDGDTLDDFVTTLQYTPVVGDVIAGILLTQAIVDQIKNGGESRDEWLAALTFIPRVGDIIGGVVLTVDVVSDLMQRTNGQAKYTFEEESNPWPDDAYAPYDNGTCPEGYYLDRVNNWCLKDDRLLLDIGPVEYDPTIDYPDIENDRQIKYWPRRCETQCEGFVAGTCTVTGCEGFVPNSENRGTEENKSENERQIQIPDLQRWRDVCCLNLK